MPGLHQLEGVFLVLVQALTLPIWSCRPTDVRTLVPGEAQPLQGREQPVLVMVPGAGLIGVLDAQNHFPTLGPRIGNVEERDVGGADVGGTGWRGGDAYTDVSHNCERCVARAGFRAESVAVR